MFNSRKLLVIGLIMMSIGLPTHAKLYKWTDENGQVHFSQTPPLNQTQQKFESLTTKSPRKQVNEECCHEVRSLASEIATALRGGMQLVDVHAALQGSSNIPTKEVANFVSDKVNLGLSPVQISQMAFGACINAKFLACSYRDSSGRLTEKQGTGSGFFVSRDGYVLTNHHVAGDCGRVTVGDQQVPAALIGSDSISDLALLRLTEPMSPDQSIATFRRSNPELGEPVIAAGYPLSGLLASELNITTGNISARHGMNNDTRHIQITAPVQSGNSGGPLLDSNGNVIGVVVGKLNHNAVARNRGVFSENVNFAVEPNRTKAFLREYQVQFVEQTGRTQSAGLTPTLSTATISKQAEAFTVPIACLR